MISGHNVIHHYLCIVIVSSEKSNSNGYLSERIRLVEVVTYETGQEDHGGWCELAEDQKQTELVTEYWSRIRPQHFLVWFQPPQHSTAELATKAIRRYAKISQSRRRSQLE